MSSPSTDNPRSRLNIGGYVVLAAAVWLAWEVIKVPIAQRAPPTMAIRVAPGSPTVLQRAAEGEFAAKRYANAQDLANEALVRAPFSVPALRVRGLTEAQTGDVVRANDMLTLAGNWSLRDDPAHAWLVEYRLRRGDYSSSFAHADTLARRRPDLYSQLFDLFGTAALQDPRALPALVDLLAKDPPWRLAFIETLHTKPASAPLVGALALSLQKTSHPFTTFELQRLYTVWLEARRFEGIRQVRGALRKPDPNTLLQNGDFSVDVADQILPFGWTLGSAPGLSGVVYEDDLRQSNMAYRLDYDGFGMGVALEQTLILAPGAYVLSGEQRVETPAEDLKLEWRLRCAETGVERVVGRPVSGPAQENGWLRFSYRFEVPAGNCNVQTLKLATRPTDRRTSIAIWLDKLSISQARPSDSPRVVSSAVPPKTAR